MTSQSNRKLILGFFGGTSARLTSVELVHPNLCDPVGRTIGRVRSDQIKELSGTKGMRMVALFFVECAMYAGSSAEPDQLLSPVELWGSRPSAASSLYDALEKKDERAQAWKTPFGYLKEGGLAEPFLNCAIFTNRIGQRNARYVVGLRHEDGAYLHLSPAEIELEIDGVSVTGKLRKIQVLAKSLQPIDKEIWRPTRRFAKNATPSRSSYDGRVETRELIELSANKGSAFVAPATVRSNSNSTACAIGVHGPIVGSADDESAAIVVMPSEVPVELTIGGSLDNFSPEQEHAIIQALDQLLRVDGIQVILKRRGSIILTIKLSREKAIELIELHQNDELKRLGILKAVILNEATLQQDLANERKAQNERRQIITDRNDAQVPQPKHPSLRSVKPAAGRTEKIYSQENYPSAGEVSRSDERLFDAYARGDSAAFAQLVNRYQRELYHFLVRFLDNRASAEDVFQDTFLQVHKSAAQFDPQRRFRPWLFTIAANEARDLIRLQARRPGNPLQASVSPGDDESGEFIDLMKCAGELPSEPMEKRELQQLVRDTFTGMPEHLREILLLSYFHQFPYKQLSKILDIPLGTVKSRLHAGVVHFAARVSGSRKKVSLDDSDRRCMDTILDTPYEARPAAPELNSRIAVIQHALDLLAMMPTIEPPADLGDRTLRWNARVRNEEFKSHSSDKNAVQSQDGISDSGGPFN